jgi:hypothetical protein
VFADDLAGRDALALAPTPEQGRRLPAPPHHYDETATWRDHHAQTHAA